jgi:hypothetical protein
LATEALVENNISRYNHEDGIEIRFQDYTGPMLNITIRNNQFYGNGQDGLQLVSYNVLTNRTLTIEHNLIRNNTRVGLGMMDSAQSGEDYRAASIPERIYLFNNTFDGNKYALTGGDNLVAVNNIFANSTTQGLKNVDGGRFTPSGTMLRINRVSAACMPTAGDACIWRPASARLAGLTVVRQPCCAAGCYLAGYLRCIYVLPGNDHGTDASFTWTPKPICAIVLETDNSPVKLRSKLTVWAGGRSQRKIAPVTVAKAPHMCWSEPRRTAAAWPFIH